MCIEAIMFGTKAAASSGLFGSAGNYGLGQTLSSLGSASGIFSSIYSSQTQQVNYDYQAHMANYNAAIADNNAVMAKQASEYEADLFDSKLNRMMSTQTTKFAKSGVVINQDTPLDVSADTSSEGALERLAILYRGQTEADASRASSTNQRFASVNAKQNASRAKYGGYLNAAGAAATGANRLGLLT
tara:strand:+ start:647 stop:1207 length:561 start_codon:yes stop_codon:yes gene_type:complete